MLLKYFENKLESVTNLDGINDSFKLLNDFKEYVEIEKCFELKGKVIKKAYEVDLKTECYDFIKDFDINTINNISDFKLRSCLVHILLFTSIITGNLDNKEAHKVVKDFNYNDFHPEYRTFLVINTAEILRKHGLISKSIDLLKKYSAVEFDSLLLLNLAFNYSLIDDFKEETKIYERLEKLNDNSVNDIIFFRKAKILIKTKNKVELKKLIKDIDTYKLLKPIKYRNIRYFELYEIFSFLNDRCKAKFFLTGATKSKYKKIETEVRSRERALEILEKEFK